MNYSSRNGEKREMRIGSLFLSGITSSHLLDFLTVTKNLSTADIHKINVDSFSLYSPCTGGFTLHLRTRL
jgi:hypothetical protein